MTTPTDPLRLARGDDLWTLAEARLAGGGSLDGATLARLCNSSQRSPGTPRDRHEERIGKLMQSYPLTWQACCEHSARTGTTRRSRS